MVQVIDLCFFKGKVEIELLCRRHIILKIEQAAPHAHSIKVLSPSSPRTTSVYSSFKNWLLHSYIKVSSILIFLIFFFFKTTSC